MTKYIDVNSEENIIKINEHFEKMAIAAQEKAQRMRQYKKQEIMQEKANDEDGIYSILTNEQIDKYLDLYYKKILHEELLNAKYKALEREAISQGKSLKTHINPADPLCGTKTIIKMEEQTKEQQTKKEKIKDTIKAAINDGTLCATLISIPVIVFGALVTGAQATTGNLSLTPMIVSVAISAFVAASLITEFGLNNIKIIMKHEKIREEMKKTGVYDSILESIKADEEYNEYVKNLENETGRRLI